MERKLKCILLVEDDHATNFLHKMILQKAGVAENILVALNGKEALTIIRDAGNQTDGNSLKPDLIFLDINMPIMNGWEFIEEYKKLADELKNNTTIIMLSASMNPDDRTRAGDFAEIKGFRSKPLSKAMVVEIINANFGS
ncbi:MAG: response regulator [Bacteroidetes bacterium]|nr:response regulator [Bacteroidota bacterium]